MNVDAIPARRSRPRVLRPAAVLAIALLLAAACGENDPSAARVGAESSTTSSSTTTSTTSGQRPGVDVIVESDVAYYQAPSGDVLLLDVYHPATGEDLPLVVVFHSNPIFGRSKGDVTELATVIAGRGAVVVAPAYGAQLPMSDMGAIADAIERWYNDEGPCAVWAALDLAASFGADPTLLVVVGDVTGTLPARGATFSSPIEISGCMAPPVEATIATTILFESDWFFVPDIWDAVLAEDPGLLNRVVPWEQITTPTATRLRILSGERIAPNTTRSIEAPTYLQSDWIRLRDPDGQLADAFAAAGAFDDGELSFAEVMQVVAGLLAEGGWDADFAFVPGVGHELSSDASRELTADLVFEDLAD